MAAGDHGPVETLPHRMVGFSDALGWRPLLFVEAIIPERACALCGVVCRKAVRLCCAHTLCSDCHSECIQQGGAYPLDQEPFCEDDLLRLECSAGYLEKRRVACWNAQSGCNFTGPIPSLLEHFKQCAFHAVPCPLCRSPVIRSNIVRHCRDGCSSRPAMDTIASNRLSRERYGIEQARDEVKEALGKISEDLISLQSSLNQCCEDIRATDTSCRELLEDQASRLGDLNALCTARFTEERRALQSIAVDMTTTVTPVCSSRELVTKEPCTQRDQLIAATNGLSPKPTLSGGPKTYPWHIANWAAMKSTALGGGSGYSESPKWDAFGYSVGLYIRLVKSKNQELHLSCFFRICPGSSDPELEWPFSKSLVFGIVHPKDMSQDISCEINAGLHGEKCYFQNPEGKANFGIGAFPLCSADKLDTGGFVSDDTVHLFLQVEP
ncbi:unnamed protein product [Ixodes hexagonus]